MNKGISIIFSLNWTPVYPNNSVTFSTQLPTIEGGISPVRVLDREIELGKVETTGKPVSIDEVINHIEEALND